MTHPTRHILVLDGPRATQTLGAMRLIRRVPDNHSSTNPHADSCAPLQRVPSEKYRYKPLDHAGHRDWDGIDQVYDDERQFDAEEEQIGPEEAARRAIIRHPALKTVDGIQLYCFRNRFPYVIPPEYIDPNAQDPNHLEYWMRRLGEQLENGEKLDAIVIPQAIDRKAVKHTERFLERVKRDWPEIKIFMIQERVSSSAFYPEAIDAIVTRSRTAEVTRRDLGIPQLPTPDPDQQFRLNQEAGRLRELARGRTPETLQPWYKRAGDPGYVPSGGKDKGGSGRG